MGAKKGRNKRLIGLSFIIFHLSFSAALLLTGCGNREPKTFTMEVLNRMTPVKDQGRSQTCWVYAMLAAIETEHIMKGDSVNLSAAWVEKMLEREPAAPKSKRGMGQACIDLIQRHGLVAYDAMRTTDTPLPQHAFMLGAEYTPQEFACSVCAPDEYVALTCVDDKPYYRYTVLDVEDNWARDSFYNVPVDTLLDRVERAVRSGRGVCWESKAHAMAVVGIAHDETDRQYFVMKNSWGDHGPYHGLRFLSLRKMRRETLAVVMPRDAFSLYGR